MFTISAILVAICVVILVGCLCMGGVLMMFGSFFFEVTAAQMTLGLVVQHILLFLGGALCVSVGIAIGRFLLVD